MSAAVPGDRPLLDLTDDERADRVARAHRDPEAQRELAAATRAAFAELRREDPPGTAGAFDSVLAAVVATLPEDTPAHALGQGYLRGEVDRAALLADPQVRAAVAGRLRAHVSGPGA
ncbi:hypothetical protein SAMN04489844_2506 [Nocardioides exalbidus]|uniref:Uncharacterized protein n=1 Tax=Nocardioides exalbidus TaxID=402596 RepID=A0A1H4TFF2_9ACTN|nr:hypothetical protein [Nocardioides exalbidus]SEC55049.1 hypothetical protein SAMN04489844_2506 [Nocardioides exalbidus]